MTIEQIVAVVVTVFGGGAGIALLIKRVIESLIEKIRAETKIALAKVETETKQDDTITNFSIEFNAERRQLQESNNRLQAELMEVRLTMAKEEGRREELRLAIASQDDKSRKMEARILELEKYHQQHTERIKELENQIAELEKRIAAKDDEIEILQLQKRALESELETQRNRADALSRQLKVHQDEAEKQSTAQSVDDTVTGVTANTQVIPPQTVTDGHTATHEDTDTNAA